MVKKFYHRPEKLAKLNQMPKIFVSNIFDRFSCWRKVGILAA
jgi:hypothetical protein